jgi:hypothetical protein
MVTQAPLYLLAQTPLYLLAQTPLYLLAQTPLYLLAQTPLHLPMSIFAKLLQLRWDPLIMKTHGVTIPFESRAHATMQS